MQVFLERPSLCPCGETFLNDDIKKGTVYCVRVESINPTNPWKLGCGKCMGHVMGFGTAQFIRPTHPDAQFGTLPTALFKFALGEG